jgi:hypothetical protein
MKRLSKPTLIAFATTLVIVPAASAMPVTDPGKPVTPRAYVVPTTNLTDGWYSAAVQQTPLTDGWYTAALQQTPLTDGWYSAAVKAPSASTPAIATPSSNSFSTRNIVLLLVLASVLTAAFAVSVRRTRRESHIPVLQ